MTGNELRRFLLGKGFTLKDVAEKMEMSPANFSNLMKVKSVSTATLEKLCKVLDCKIDFFYKGTEYEPIATCNTAVSSEKSVSAINSKVYAVPDSDSAERIKLLEQLVEEKERTITILLNTKN